MVVGPVCDRGPRGFQQLAMQPILQDLWEDTDCHDLSGLITRDHWHPSLVDLVNPRVLQAKASKYDADNPS